MPELRTDPVLHQRVIVAPDRAARPFVLTPDVAEEAIQRCAFCRGQEAQTPDSVLLVPNSVDAWRVRVIPNRYPALTMSASASPAAPASATGPGQAGAIDTFPRERGLGIHEVVIEHPEHVTQSTALSSEQWKHILFAWRERVRSLQQQPGIEQVIVFKNNGAGAGASMEHVHSQILATPFLSRLTRDRLIAAEKHQREHGSNLWLDILNRERQIGSRLVLDGNEFAVFCPFASRFPGEMCLLPSTHQPDFSAVPDNQLPALAATLHESLQRLQSLFFEAPFNLVVQTAPVNDPRRALFQWHIEIIPRTTSFGGLELGHDLWINTTSPESAAARMREPRKPQ